MKYLIFLILIFSQSLFSDHHLYLNEIDSLKNVLKTQKPTNLDYHFTIIEIFRDYRFNKRDSAKYYIDYGYKIAQKYNIEDAIREYYNLYGLYYFDEGDFALSLENFYKCMRLSAKLGEYGAVGFSYNDIGYVFYVQGLWDLALQHYKEGINGLEIKDSSKLSPIPFLYQNIGLCFGHLNQLDSAKKYLDLTIEYSLRNNDSIRINHTKLYLANIYSRNNIDRLKADSIYREILKFFSKNNEWLDGHPYTLYYLGMNLEDMNQLDSAEKYYKLAINELDRIGWDKKKIDINYSLLKLYLKSNDFKKVDSILDLNEILIDKFSTIDLISDKYFYKYMTFEKKGQFDSAFYYLKKYTTTKDSILLSSVNGKVTSVTKDMQIIQNIQEKKLIQEKNIQRMFLLIFIIILGIFLFVLVYSRLRLQKKNVEIVNQKNEELSKINKKLDDANQTKDKFFSIIAHDLKNPIGAIKGTSEMLDKDYEMFSEEEKKETINQIYKASSSLQGLLDSLLTWSRSQRGIIEFQPEIFDLNWMFNSITSLLESNASSKNIKIKKEIKDSLEINADINMINTIIRNLLSNAIKFTPEGGTIILRAFKDSIKTTIEVEDNGIGISKENISKLFNFSTTYTTDGTNSEKGTGLGLVLVKEFIDKHNGTIDIESELGKGTKFIIEIPNA